MISKFDLTFVSYIRFYVGLERVCTNKCLHVSPSKVDTKLFYECNDGRKRAFRLKRSRKRQTTSSYQETRQDDTCIRSKS